MIIKYITVVFCVVLMGIVLIANLGYAGSVFSFLRNIPGGDKTGHFFLMGMFSFLVNLGLLCKRIRFGNIKILKGSLIVAFIVTVEEFSQIWLQYRGFDLGDLFCDYLGILCFGFIAQQVIKSNFKIMALHDNTRHPAVKKLGWKRKLSTEKQDY